MRIDRVSLYHLRMPLRSPFETSFGRANERECILLSVHAAGLTGYGECTADAGPGYAYETTGTAWHILRDFLVPVILGKPLPEPLRFQAQVAGLRGHPMAKAGLEMALWDLKGKVEGRSLREMLGGTRADVAVGISVGIQASPDVLVEVIAGYLAQGYGRIKIKIKPGRDVAEARAVRCAFPAIPLQVDANSAYTLASAEALTPLDEMDLLLIEQPLAEDDLWDHSRLQAALRTPICLDESILSERHARQALEMGACRIIHDLCRAHDVPVWCGGMLETGVGRAANLALASLPGFTLPGDISASDRYYAQDITQERFTLNPDSTITVPTAPGVGVTVDRESLERFTLSKLDIWAGAVPHNQ
jgi:O-succinylbenzoate synthase